MLRLGKYVIGRIDVAGGRFTYGNRIAVGLIFQSNDKSDYQKLKALYKEICGFTPYLLPRFKRFRVLDRLADGIAEWIKKEQDMLHYEPNDDEKRAGVKEYMKNVGEFATIKSLAKEYSKDPDEILKWEYSKVFGILYSNLEEHKYKERYQKIIDEKYKRGNKYNRK